MFYFLSVFVGMLIAIMITFNGELSSYYGVYLSAVIIHIIGSVFAYTMMRFSKEKLVYKHHLPLWYYLGGVMGVITTYCNNFAFGKISLTSMIALVLLGQTLTSIVIDTYGWFGMKQYPFQKHKWVGLSFALLGIIMMFDAPHISGIFAIVVSVLAGITVILSRTFNAKLGEHVGVIQGSFFNHLIGLPLCILLFILLDHQTDWAVLKFSSSFSIYLGGILGVLTVLLFNVLVPKVAAFPLTILSFVGQIFTSMVLDIVLLQTTDYTTLRASLIIAFGIGINMILDQKKINIPISETKS